MKRKKKKAGFWYERINCEIEVRMFLKKNNCTSVPPLDEFKLDGGIPHHALVMLGGRKGISEMTGLPIKESAISSRKGIAVFDQLNGEKVIPSKAFEIEREARKQGLHYADIQKAKTLAMVGGVKI